MGLEFVEAASFIGDMIELTDGVVKTQATRGKKNRLKSLFQGAEEDQKVNDQDVSTNDYKTSKNTKNKKKQNSELDEKSRAADEQRKANYEEAKAKNSFKQELGQNSDKLREAIILAEIIGQPRCKTRQSRRARRV